MICLLLCVLYFCLNNYAIYIHCGNLPCRVELAFLAASLNLFYLSGEITALETGTVVLHTLNTVFLVDCCQLER